MKDTYKINLQLFADENVIVAADMEPAISIDHTNKLEKNIKELTKVLGITEMTPMASGTVIKLWKLVQENDPEQVAEGEKIPLTKFKRVPDRTIELELETYRKEETAKTVQKIGKDKAINDTDEALVKSIQMKIRNKFFASLLLGTGKADGTGIQDTLANIWGELQDVYADEEVTPIYFVNSKDVAKYLGNAQLTMQKAFGFSYIEDFLGLGTVVVSPKVTQGKPIGTAKENLNGCFVPAGSGDVGRSLGLTADSTGYVGMKHYVNNENANLGTLALSGVEFYPELLDGIIVGTIGTGA